MKHKFKIGEAPHICRFTNIKETLKRLNKQFPSPYRKLTVKGASK